MQQGAKKMTTTHPANYSVGSDEKAAQVMVYTTTSLIWGDVVVKEMIRVSTWLRTNAAPDRITIYNARVLVTTSPNAVKPSSFSEINIGVPAINAYHLAPPGKDPLDYDPTEPNRKMEPVSAILGTFQFKGNIRLSTNLDLRKHLEITREPYSALYDVEVTHLLIPTFGPINIPYVLVRQETALFGKI
jgi:hypothetical protein